MSTKSSPVTALAQVRTDTSYPSPATVRVAVAGEVDLATASVLRQRLLSVLYVRSPAVLDVDLAGVTFLDCAGLGALVGVHNAAVDTGCQVRVSHPQPIVRRVLEVTGLLGVFSAPIGRPASLHTGSDHRFGTVPAPATVTPEPAVMVAA